eukprot:TRINITY_DN5101_c0_g1_i6.p3 TRINITY_DN5101_c0_g1~~TRINITY_DN5101_c0_g1_i6.p3  ORF type:complete len:139 (-),score=4.48 TRINITY_DN5101_c0_g1_i6:14-430(-)
MCAFNSCTYLNNNTYNIPSTEEDTPVSDSSLGSAMSYLRSYPHPYPRVLLVITKTEKIDPLNRSQQPIHSLCCSPCKRRQSATADKVPVSRKYGKPRFFWQQNFASVYAFDQQVGRVRQQSTAAGFVFWVQIPQRADS